MATLADDTLARVRAGMSSVKNPSGYDRVYKDECMFSFDTPFSADGRCGS